MDGNMTEQEKVLRAKCAKMASVFNQCPMSATDAQQGYNSVFLPSITYPLAATQISWDKLESIQSSVTLSVLPRMGFNRHFPRAVVYAPKHCGGLGLKHLAVEQGVAHVTSIMAQIRANTQLGQMFMVLIEAFQVSSGLITPVLEDTRPIRYLDSPWINTLRDFLHMTSASILIPQLPQLYPLREHDRSIMDIALRHNFSTATLDDINRCRMFLQVTTIAEITNSEGNAILSEAFHGSTDENNNPLLWKHSKTLITWPRQPQPDAPTWKKWQKCLRTILQKNTRKYILENKLGLWLPSCTQYRTWTYYHDTEGKIFHHNSDLWTLLSPLQSSRRKIICNINNGTPSTQPISIHPITALTSDLAKVLFVLPQPGLYTVPIFHKEIKTLNAFIRNKSDWFKQVFPIIRQCHPEPLQALLNASASHIASDGGLKYDNLTYGWVIATESEILWEGYGVVPPALQNSTLRAESYGGLAANHFYNAIHQYNHLPQQSRPTHFWTDSLSLSQRLIKKLHEYSLRPTSCLAPEFNSINETAQLLSTTAKPRIHHVKGHQQGPDLTWEAQLNNRCDVLATEARTLPTPKSLSTIPTAVVTLTINGNEVPGSIQSSLRHAALSQDLCQYFQKKYNWNDSVVDYIDWTPHSRAIKRLRGRSSSMIQKFIHEWLPVNAHPGTALPTTGQLCPCCRLKNETQNHLLQCQHPIMSKVWTESAQCLQDLMTKNNTDPFLKKLIISAFTIWRTTPDPPRPEFLPIRYHELFRTQSEIGWDQIIKGRLSIHWVQHQDAFADINQLKISGETWASTTIRQIWEQFSKVWKKRCQEHHGEGQTNSRQATLQRLEPKVQAIYSMKDRLDQIDRTALSRPIQEILNLPSGILERWVRRQEQFVRDGVARARRREKNSLRSITEFFQATVFSRTIPVTLESPTRRHNRSAQLPRPPREKISTQTTLAGTRCTLPPPPRPTKKRKKKPPPPNTTHDIRSFFNRRPTDSDLVQPKDPANYHPP
jgi:hypothetical protein